MAKRQRSWNYDKYQKYIKAGRGQGDGLAYLPWITIHDFSSRGIVSRVYGQKAKRVHHFLSRNELYYFYLLEWSNNVLDIREQYPLMDIDLAVDVADKAEIKYPRDNISGFPYVLTCDFMVTTQNGLKARTIKSSSELKNIRVLEKLEIERRYWKELDIDWRLVTEKDISLQKARNIEWLHTAATLPEWLSSRMLKEYLLRELGINASILQTVSSFDDEFRLPLGSGLLLFKHLLWTRDIICDMGREIQLAGQCSQVVDVRERTWSV